MAVTAQDEIIDLWSNDAIMVTDHKAPISRQDLEVDSQEAVDIFAEDEAVATCLRPRTDSIRPLAEMWLQYANRILTWRLKLQGCSNAGNSRPYLYLNAQTGELIEFP